MFISIFVVLFFSAISDLFKSNKKIDVGCKLFLCIMNPLNMIEEYPYSNE